MITFCILLAILAGVTYIALACGGWLIALVGNLIVCGLIIWLLVKLFRRKK